MYEIKIPCPDKPEHEATLFTHGHEYAGIWECDTCETSDVCAHEDVHFDLDESFVTLPWEWVYSKKIIVCDLCDCIVEDSEAHLIEQDCWL